MNYGEPDQRPLHRVTTRELREHFENREFGAGSMRPKVEACMHFGGGDGERAVITVPERLGEALSGGVGTILFD